MTIGKLASLAGLAGSTIRYYERLGLICSAGRTNGNYRYFEVGTIDRLQFIRAAKASGLSLEDVRALLEVRDGTVAPCAEVQAVIEARLVEVNGQMKHLRNVQRVLKNYRDACEKTARGTTCPVLDTLGDRKRSPGRKRKP